MPTDISQDGPHAGKPVEQVRRRFEEYLKHNDFPEDFEGVAKDVKPPKDRGFTIIHKDVTVSPGARQRLSKDPDHPSDCYLPCNLCGPAPKFKNCGYAILCDNGWIYFVGNNCATKHYEGKFSDAKRDFDRDAAERRAQEYFYENADRIPLLAEHARQLREIAETYAPTHKVLKRLPTFRKALRDAITIRGGWLPLVEIEQVQLPDGTSVSREKHENFARITGETAVRGEFNMDQLLRDNTSLLDGFGSSADEVLEAIVATQTDDKLPELYAAVRRAEDVVNMVRDDLVKYRAFFQPGNLETIQDWLRKRSCEVTCHAENQGRVWWFRVYTTDKRRPIDTSVFDSPIPKPPR